MSGCNSITQIITTSTIKAAANHHQHCSRIELTAWDLQFLLLTNIQKGILFFKPETIKVDNIINQLQTSLSRTLDLFSPLAGRLATENHHDGTSSYFITCNNAGAEFIHAVADGVTVADILDPVYVPLHIVRSFFPPYNVINMQGVTNPLLVVQVTELTDGYFIGCSLNHVVGDGTTFWNFFNAWSNISRGESIPTPSPVLHRWFPESNAPPLRLHLSHDESLIQNYLPRPLPPLLKERVFHFTKEKIAILKSKVNAADRSTPVSSLQAILCHLWRTVTRSRCLHPDLEIQIVLVIGARPRLNPPLSDQYLGNSLHRGVVKIRAGKILDEDGLNHVASEMNEMVVSQTTEESVRKFIELWTESPKFKNMADVVVTKDSLSISSSPRFNVYGNDFGWGKPVAVRSGGAFKADGKVTIFPGKEEGSVDLETCFLAKTLETMANDPEFVNVVTL